MDKSDLIDYRPAEESDLNFIFSTWCKGLLGGNDFYRMIDPKAFYENYGEFLKRKLAKPGVLVLIACLKETPDVIIGYSVTEKIKGLNVVHWVYVKKDWRRIGIAKEILPSQIHIATSMTKLAKQIKPKGLVFNPFI